MKKIKSRNVPAKNLADPRYIITEPGIGYRMENVMVEAAPLAARA